MKHVRGHQDKRARKEKLTIVEKLNIKADRSIGEKPSIPKKMNTHNSLFEVYVNNKFIPNNFVKEIRQHCGKKRQQYIWSTNTGCHQKQLIVQSGTYKRPLYEGKVTPKGKY